MTRILRVADLDQTRFRPTVASLGMFDGMHLGHQRLVHQLQSWSQEFSPPCETAIVLINPDFPGNTPGVLPGRKTPSRLMGLDQKIASLASHGINNILVLDLTVENQATTAESFVLDVLVGALQARGVLLGYDSRFGNGARGDFNVLQSLASAHGFAARQIARVDVNGHTVSSTAICAALGVSDFTHAAAMLGRSYRLSGLVTQGAQRGRTIGFPTANVQLHHSIPLANGVYGAAVFLAHETTARDALINIGVRPTVATTGERTLEAHVLNFSGEVYGQPISVEPFVKLREEQQFPSIAALKLQIEQDRATFLAILDARR